MTLALFVAVSIASSLLLLRGRSLQRWLALYAGGWVLFGMLAAIARPLRVAVEPRLAFIVFGVLVMASLWAFAALVDPLDVRWSANRAAVLAAMVYAVVIPLMLHTPIDGDEPFYLLQTESMVHDRDLDLSNQYRDLQHSATGRTDLVPQLGDPIGPHGERYSRHEPFLPLLMIPGYLVGRLPGAIAIIALFGALLARSTVRLFEEEGIDDATTRAVFPFIALGPPILFYATRIWPEVPAAFCFVEAVRGARQRRAWRWMPALFGLVLLKLRFVLVAIVLLVRAIRGRRQAALAVLALAIPLAIVAFTSGTVHRLGELIPGTPAAMLRGLFGLLLDGAGGILFQAPIYAFGVIALTRWRSMPAGFRLGMSSSVVYLLYLIPREEWHGGWSPPLRYVVVFMPFLGLGAAALWRRIDTAPIVAAAAWTIALVVHGLAYPWRLFHIQNGENVVGETLSMIWHSDFSRLFPSFIRPNFAAVVAAILAVMALFVFRSGRLISPAVLAIVLAVGFVMGRRPGARIEFEDAHVIHNGGELYPQEFQVHRFTFRGGWIIRPGDTLSFLARGGPSTLQYAADASATIQIGGQAYVLPPTHGYGSIRVDIARGGRVELRSLAGTVNLDRMDNE
jgi:hypothetical protein